MNQGAVLGLRRGHFQRVPASSRRLWAPLEGGSLTIQLPHRDTWALGLCTISTGPGAVCVCVSLSSSKKESRGKIPSLIAERAAFISTLPKLEF